MNTDIRFDPGEEDGMPPFLTVDQACRIMGVTERTLRKWISERKLPSYRMGDGKRKLIRLKRSDVAEFVKLDIPQGDIEARFRDPPRAEEPDELNGGVS